MKFEVVESADGWIVLSDGAESGRFDRQEDALSDVADRLREAQRGEAASLTVRYAAK